MDYVMSATAHDMSCEIRSTSSLSGSAFVSTSTLHGRCHGTQACGHPGRRRGWLSALMGADEAGTFNRLRAGRKELFEPEIKKHHGSIFKLMGDGLLAEFSSVVDAVECAVTLQRGMMERHANVPESKRIKVRIGINLGEVIVEGKDRFGEGVNIAARLQQLAEPGGIC